MTYWHANTETQSSIALDSRSSCASFIERQKMQARKGDLPMKWTEQQTNLQDAVKQVIKWVKTTIFWKCWSIITLVDRDLQVSEVKQYGSASHQLCRQFQLLPCDHKAHQIQSRQAFSKTQKPTRVSYFLRRRNFKQMSIKKKTR